MYHTGVRSTREARWRFSAIFDKVSSSRIVKPLQSRRSSSVAEHYFRKVETWVRFPSSAPQSDFQTKDRLFDGTRFARPTLLASKKPLSSVLEYLLHKARTHFSKNS